MPWAREEGSSHWWDREFDDEGIRIRSDVRQAAHDKWPEARNRVRVALGDATEAAELMEPAVVHISRYLDRHHIPLFTYQNVSSLLMLHFRQELRRRVGRSRRVEPITEANFEQAVETESWLGISPYTARNSFWREVREAKAKTRNKVDPPE